MEPRNWPHLVFWGLMNLLVEKGPAQRRFGASLLARRVIEISEGWKLEDV